MMTLTNFQGDTLQLWINGYQYPDSVMYYCDLNWLDVSIRWQRGYEIWQASDPCLTTEEVLGLLDWFKALPACPTVSTSLWPLEQTVSFEWLTGRQVLRICLQDAFDPRHSDNLPLLLQSLTVERSADDDSDSFFLEFPLSPEDIETQVQAIQTMAARFPVRHEINHDEG